jgi:endonuclease/exonuclease/phosphatase family metal-dependent hydrolase
VPEHWLTVSFMENRGLPGNQQQAPLRIATFNLESLDESPQLSQRIARLRPQLAALEADLLCLQEVNAQKPDSGGPRRLLALDALLAGTAYADYRRVSTATPDGDPADVHNLVILSRFPVETFRQWRHEMIPAPLYRPATALPRTLQPQPIEWDRPALQAEIALSGGRTLHLVNLHLRAPLAAPVAGQKLSASRWSSTGGWAEGQLIAAIKRIGQAVETRLLVDRLFAADHDALVVVAGDLNADSHEMPVRVLLGEPEDTGNPALAHQRLRPVEAAVPAEQRFSVRHRGRKLMLDHLLVSPALHRRLASVAIANDGLLDEAAATEPPSGSFHAAIVAAFDL